MKKRVEENPEERMNKLYISLAITHLLLLGILMPFSSSSSLFRTLAFCFFFVLQKMFIYLNYLVGYGET